MKIAVIGAGAIGGLVAGYLKKHGQTASGGCGTDEVVLIGRPDSVKTVRDKGLKISGARGVFDIKIDAAVRLESKVDLAILAVKSQDVEAAVKDSLPFIKDAQLLTTENGIRADDMAAALVPAKNIISSIVMFGATALTPAEVVHNFEGNWIIARAFAESDAKVKAVAEILGRAFTVNVAEPGELKGMKYLKVFINANNCIPAILGVSMQEAFADIEVAQVAMGIWREGLDIVRRAGVKLVSLPDFPLERLTKLAALPIPEAAKIFSGIMVNLSKEPLYGSILQSIKRGRPSEIDYINGEFVRLAGEYDLNAPLNRKLTEMVHEVERAGRFFSKPDFLGTVLNLFGDGSGDKAKVSP